MRIALVTSNPFKTREFELALGSHGQKVTVVAPDAVEGPALDGLLQEGHDVVIRETTSLVSRTTGEELVSPYPDMELAVNKSLMAVWRMGAKGQIVTTWYKEEVEGFISITGAGTTSEEVFGWDDIFHPLEARLDYHSLKRRSVKTSARQLNIGRFLADHVHFEARLDMQFFPMEQKTTFEFTTKAYEFVTGNDLIIAGTSDHWLRSILSNVLESGIFFRSSASRREKNYWLPGANAGIPLTRKKDPVHEITFLFHDLMHFQLPDLIPDAVGAQARDVYVAHRVLGEALTLVLADMVFVDNMRRNGVDYDFSKRLIHPLYEMLAVAPGLPGLRAIVKAMGVYAVRNDDSQLRAMLVPGEAGVAALEAFKDKYGWFFMEDLRWTERNFDQFQNRKDYIADWIGIVGRETLEAQGLTLLSAFIDEIGLRGDGDPLDAIFDHVFDRVVVPNASTAAVGDAHVSVSNAFKRYMIGQLSIFARFGDLFDMPAVRTKILEKVRCGRTLAPDEIARTRALYGAYVDGLRRRSLIDDSDAITYRSMHPLFPPFYVFYDEKKS